MKIRIGRMMNNKGIAPVAIVLIVAGVVVVAVAVAVIFGGGGLGFGGGTGDGEGDGNISKAEVIDSAEVIPEIEEIKYVEITVSGKDYWYNNTKYTLDDLVDELKKQETDLPAKITDNNSSLNAYSGLKEMLRDNNIRFIEAQ